MSGSVSLRRRSEGARKAPKPTKVVGGRINRSVPMRGLQRALAYVPLGLFLAYTFYTHISWGMNRHIFFLSTFFTFVAILIFGNMISGINWRSFTHLPPAAGRVIAIMPVYNEESHLVHQAIHALLKQTILPDIIHVVDDGSKVPLETFEDPLIRWHRIPNSGKREAQAHALKMHEPGEFDYIMTVDSDSVCDPDALEHLLRSMKDDRVQASTGMIFVRNWNTNLLTRLTDINVITSCLLMRMLRSWLGIVSPTSGALALYRSEVVYDNLDDYLTSGTAGDDRRLSFYALMRGQVVGVTESVVETQLPDKWGACFRQRMRWSKSAWLGTGFVLTNLRPLVVFFYCFPLVFALLWPFVVTTLAIVAVRYQSPVLVNGLIFWCVISITQTMIYAIYRPDFTMKQRFIQGSLGIVYPILGFVILRPAAYWALTKLKDNSWHTREDGVEEMAAA
jgi:cellulose synthase/poly-beta-1,6-N-acetylglucosamine synthase-like glycosyltransferase